MLITRTSPQSLGTVSPKNIDRVNPRATTHGLRISHASAATNRSEDPRRSSANSINSPVATSNDANSSLEMKPIRTLADLEQFGGKIVAFQSPVHLKLNPAEGELNHNLRLGNDDKTGFAYLPAKEHWTHWKDASWQTTDIAPQLYKIISSGGGSSVALTPSLLAEAPDLKMRFATKAEKTKLAEKVQADDGPNLSFSQNLPDTPANRSGSLTAAEQADYIRAH